MIDGKTFLICQFQVIQKLAIRQGDDQTTDCL